MECTKCYGTSFKKDRCENCGKHKDRPVANTNGQRKVHRPVND